MLFVKDLVVAVWVFEFWDNVDECNESLEVNLWQKSSKKIISKSLNEFVHFDLESIRENNLRKNSYSIDDFARIDMELFDINEHEYESIDDSNYSVDH